MNNKSVAYIFLIILRVCNGGGMNYEQEQLMTMTTVTDAGLVTL